MGRGTLLVAIVALGGCVASDGQVHALHFSEMAAMATAPTPPPQTRWSTLPELGSIETALLHDRLAKTPIAYDEIAYAYKDVAGALDEFQRRDRIAAARARIDEVDRRLDKNKTLSLRIAQVLPDYDFGKGGFVTSLTDQTIIPRPSFVTGIRGSPYAIALSNGARFAFVPVSESTARTALKVGRTARLELEVEPIKAEARPVVALSPETRVLTVQVLRARLMAEQTVLGEFGDDVSGESGEAKQATAK
jgi:hypothetical protein